MDVATGKITQYKVPAGLGGIHETFSPDGRFLVSDGAAPKGENRGRDKYISKLTLPTDTNHNRRVLAVLTYLREAGQ